LGNQPGRSGGHPHGLPTARGRNHDKSPTITPKRWQEVPPVAARRSSGETGASALICAVGLCRCSAARPSSQQQPQGVHLSKPKEDAIVLEGTVIEPLPNAVFRVELENGHK